MANMGDTLKTGQFLRAGDYLVSTNGLFYAIMQYDGNFSVFWGNGPTVNPTIIWGGNQFSLGRDRFLIMQGDGNLCCYTGMDPTQQLGLVWQSGVAPGPGNYRCTLQNGGNLCVFADNGTLVWQSGNNVEDNPNNYIRSSVPNPDAPSQDYLNLAVPDNAQIGTSLILSRASSGDQKQLWTKRTWTRNGNEYAYALINQATGLFAYGPWNHNPVKLTDRCDAYALWTSGGNEFPFKPPRYAIRTYACDGWNLNVPGNSPYKPGSTAVLWDWTPGAPMNLTWHFYQ